MQNIFSILLCNCISSWIHGRHLYNSKLWQHEIQGQMRWELVQTMSASTLHFNDYSKILTYDKRSDHKKKICLRTWKNQHLLVKSHRIVFLKNIMQAHKYDYDFVKYWLCTTNTYTTVLYLNGHVLCVNSIRLTQPGLNINYWMN